MLRPDWMPLVGLLSLVISCDGPGHEECRLHCGLGGACPSETTCGDDGYCHAPGTPLCPEVIDGGPDGALDAPVDAPPHDGSIDAATPLTWSVLVAGRSHTCGLSPLGTLYCWGDGERGQLGTGSTDRVASPQRLAETWTAVAAGGHHTCGIRLGGTLWCWGENQAGQLGSEGAKKKLEPAQVRTPELGWTAVAAGQEHTCGISGGALYCFGSHGFGQLGLGNQGPPSVSSPQRVGTASDWTRVSLGEQHTCALRGAALYCWGDHGRGRLGVGAIDAFLYSPPDTPIGGAAKWIAVAAGLAQTCAIAEDKTLWCWGANDYGQLGCARREECFDVLDVLMPVQVGAEHEWNGVSVGGQHACARRFETVECWGQNQMGQVGRGWAAGDPASRDVVNPIDEGWQSVSVGAEHSCAVARDGSGWCWGSASDGQRGDGELANQARPVLVQSGLAWSSVGVGLLQHACGITEEGLLRCWGANRAGQLGDGGGEDSYVPTAVDSTAHFTAVAGGNDFSCALGEDSAVSCWGTNFSGELGSGSDGLRPAKVSFTGASDWVQLSVGRAHSCGIRQSGSDRTVWCWGANEAGQTSGATNPQDSVLRVDPLGAANWQAVSAGYQHTCGIRTGQLWCWGRGAQVPVQIGIDEDWVQVSSGTIATCGIRDNGAQRTLYCGTHQDDAAAPLINLLEVLGQPWQSVECGATHACALTAVGELFCWGNNYSGQLGDGTRAWRLNPTALQEAGPWVEVSLGDSFGCARKQEDNSLWCWGRGHLGQLGTGHGSRPWPVRVRD